MAEAERSRIVFMGTPQFAAIVLEKILSWNGGNVVAVFSGPDKRSGRGMKIVPSPVKKLALEHGLPLFQPASLRNSEIQSILNELRPDFIAVASYGLILPQEVLNAAAIVPLNVHASLLPAYRGAAPIQRAIMENFGPNAETGVSIMKMEAGLDTGPVYTERRIPIADKYQEQLAMEIAASGGEALIETMSKLQKGNFQPVPQDDSLATYAHKLEKADGIIDWNKPALEVDARIRAVTPWPGAQTTLRIAEASVPVTIIAGRVGDDLDSMKAGTLCRQKSGLAIACKDKWYMVDKLRPRGRNEMRATDFANGYCKVKNGPCGLAVEP